MTSDIKCAMCGRAARHHSFNTREVCNAFIAEGPYEAVLKAWSQIEALRAPEGHSITLICDNPDFNGKPNCAVDVCGDWTDWEDKRFEADTIFEAINYAHLAFMASPPSNGPMFETEEEAAEAADNGRNTGGKSYL